MALLDGMRQDRCDAPRAQKLTRAPDFQTLSSVQRSLAWSFIAMCDSKTQPEAVRQATAEPDAPSVAWILRFAVSTERNDMIDAVAVLQSAVDRKDDGFFQLSEKLVYPAARKLNDDDKTFSRFASALLRADWRPANPFDNGEWIWAKQAGLLMEAGDTERGRQLLERVDGPGQLLRISLDKRFDALALSAERLDLVAAAERRLAADRKALAENPRHGTGVAMVSSDLRMLGRQAEALALVDEVLATAAPIRDELGEDTRNWVVNERAMLLFELRRFDEAIRAMRAAADMEENGGAFNVSQTINLSGLLIAAGRDAEALAMLKRFEGGPRGAVSPYGEMWIAAESVCAHANLNQRDEAAEALAHARLNAKENHNAHLKALLCLGDEDGAAAALKARLNTPEERISALVALSRFLPEENETAFEKRLGEHMDAVRARPDVIAAVAAVGRTRDIPLRGGAMVDAY